MGILSISCDPYLHLLQNKLTNKRKELLVYFDSVILPFISKLACYTKIMEFDCSGSRYSRHWKIPVFIGVPVLVLLIVILGISFCLCVYVRRKRRMNVNVSKAANTTVYKIGYSE